MLTSYSINLYRRCRQVTLTLRLICLRKKFPSGDVCVKYGGCLRFRLVTRYKFELYCICPCFFLILLLYTQVYIQINIDAGLRKEFSFLKEQIQVSKFNANVRFKRNWVESFGKPTYYLTFMQPAKLITCPINHTRPVYPTANAHFTQSAYVSLIHSRPFSLRVQNIDPHFLLPKFWAGHSDLQESR